HKGAAVLLKDTEFKAYLSILVVAAIIIIGDLMVELDSDFFTALRYAAFQTASIATTGFVSADYDRWPVLSKFVLMGLMICGGCAGSTAAGLKISRVVILFRSVKSTVLHLLYPKHVVEVMMNGTTLHDSTVLRVGQYFFMYIFFILFFALLLAFDGVGGFDALGISVSTMGCIGPAFGVTGATCTYADLSWFSKTVICFSMLLGRLEIFTILVMLRPGLWKGKNTW
ncbi:MAG: TrkH family potassium uptake protein, partial [Megasphaera micronuciformis]|nr:TrkH family potassium uptake protein [Megasphaera micronuciformis]